MTHPISRRARAAAAAPVDAGGLLLVVGGGEKRFLVTDRAVVRLGAYQKLFYCVLFI